MTTKEALQRKINNFLRQADEDHGKKPTRAYIMDKEERDTLQRIKKLRATRHCCMCTYNNNVVATIETMM